MNISENIKGPQIPADFTYKQCFKQNIDSDRSLNSEYIEEERERKLKTDRNQQSKKLFQSERKQNITDSINTQKRNFLKLTMKNKLVDKFKNNLLTNSYVLPQNHKEQQYFMDDYLKGQDTQYISNTICKNLQIPTINSSSKILVIFDLLSLILNLIGLWICPFLAVFKTQLVLQQYTVIIFILLTQQFMEILIILNKSIIANGLNCEDRKIIFLAYIQNGAIPDLISLIIWILILLGYENVFIVNEVSTIIQIYIIIIRLYYKFENYFETLYIQGSISIFIDLLTLVITIFFFTHITACMWYYVGENSAQEYNNTWLKQYNLLDASPQVKYNYSFYWATMTMVTVGYGDITPQNQTEMTFVTVIMLFSSCLFAYTMNSIGIILKAIYTSKLSYKRSLVLINTYMNKHLVQPEIQTRIRTFLKNKCKQEQSSTSLELNTLIEELPLILKNDLKQNISANLTSKFTSLTMQFSKNVISKLSDKIQIISLTPGEFIYHQGDDNTAMYFINEGRIELLEESSKKSLQFLGPGESFGEYQCFTGLPPKFSALSQGFGQIVCIKRNDLLKVVQDKRKDNERFQHIKDTILMNQNYCEIFKKCNICSRYSHQNVDCPLISYKPDLEQRLLKEQYFVNQERRRFKRENYKINTKFMLREIQKSIKKFKDFSNIESPDTQSEILTFTLPIQIASKNRASVLGIAKKSQQQAESIKIIDSVQQSFNMLDQFFDQLLFHQVNIDKGEQFENYMPHNNPQNVIKFYERSRELHQVRPKLKRQYSFKYSAQIKAWQLRKWFARQIDNR